ncbi:exopolyphosphatase [Mammaliicoccus fleurettii]|uniref:exopolyphosphatase n=1 Tax=Mammaliicoccus fleurettii TaxID=150056 RepID=UPI002DBDA5CA|nr:exopolyphosphatase [Mammaliicoccus fleurettii]MEB7807335.1 exopolyphosphatase [Mammaliicoccus fleurettii]
MKRIGLIDIGSNTIRLVIFEYSVETGLNELQNIKTPARLSQFLDEDKNMNEEGINVLVETLNSFKKVAKKFHVEELVPAATAAVRQSKNVDQIIESVKSKTNLDIEIIPEQDEAFYGFYAATHTLNIENGITVDIGGGSTEVTYFENKKLKEAISFPFGVVTLEKMFFVDKDHNDKNAIKKCGKFVKEQFESEKWIKDKKVPIIGIGGSARNNARIHQSLNNYPIAGVHGYDMTKKDLEEVYDELKKSDKSDLKDLDGLSRDRTDIIIPSSIVFNTLYDITDATRFTFSRKGLREGLVMTRLKEDFPKSFNKDNVTTDALRYLANEYNINPSNGKQRMRLAEDLLNKVIEITDFEVSNEDRKLLKEAAYLYYLGAFIDADSSSQHTYYIIANSSINGFSHRDRVKLALLASFKNKSLLKFYVKETSWFKDNEIELIQKLGGIIKFANALNVSNTDCIETLELIDKKNEFDLIVDYVTDPIAEEYQSERQKKHIEKLLPKKLNIIFTQG